MKKKLVLFLIIIINLNKKIDKQKDIWNLFEDYLIQINADLYLILDKWDFNFVYIKKYFKDINFKYNNNEFNNQDFLYSFKKLMERSINTRNQIIILESRINQNYFNLNYFKYNFEKIFNNPDQLKIKVILNPKLENQKLYNKYEEILQKRSLIFNFLLNIYNNMNYLFKKLDLKYYKIIMKILSKNNNSYNINKDNIIKIFYPIDILKKFNKIHNNYRKVLYDLVLKSKKNILNFKNIKDMSFTLFNKDYYDNFKLDNNFNKICNSNLWFNYEINNQNLHLYKLKDKNWCDNKLSCCSATNIENIKNKVLNMNYNKLSKTYEDIEMIFKGIFHNTNRLLYDINHNLNNKVCKNSYNFLKSFPMRIDFVKRFLKQIHDFKEFNYEVNKKFFCNICDYNFHSTYYPTKSVNLSNKFCLRMVLKTIYFNNYYYNYILEFLKKLSIFLGCDDNGNRRKIINLNNIINENNKNIIKECYSFIKNNNIKNSLLFKNFCLPYCKKFNFYKEKSILNFDIYLIKKLYMIMKNKLESKNLKFVEYFDPNTNLNLESLNFFQVLEKFKKYSIKNFSYTFHNTKINPKPTNLKKHSSSGFIFIFNFSFIFFVYIFLIIK